MQKRRCAAENWVMRDDEPSQVHDPRCRAEEGSTVVSTVKGTRALTSAISDQRSPNAVPHFVFKTLPKNNVCHFKYCLK
jgi:hypothetical protein